MFRRDYTHFFQEDGYQFSMMNRDYVTTNTDTKLYKFTDKGHKKSRLILSYIALFASAVIMVNNLKTGNLLKAGRVVLT